MKKSFLAFLILLGLGACDDSNSSNQTSMEVNFQEEKPFEPYQPPVAYEDAKKRAEEIVAKMTLEEKIAMIGGYNMFFTKGFEKYGIPQLYFSDATGGVNIREQLPNQLEKTVAFPAPIALTSTWNTNLAKLHAQSIGEECRAGNIAVLLGPGMNIYRISQNGRNFEYFGEDPFLASRMIENYVVGMQNTGTISTLKHFIANNSDYRRRTSNSVVDERALHEIYVPAFEAGVNAGAMAVMTSYNKVNGEYAGQSKEMITGLLRNELGFNWLVMSDWWSVWDAEKVIKSGLDLDMPGEPQGWMPEEAKKPEFYLRNVAQNLVDEGKVAETDIDRMVINILATEIGMGLLDRKVQDSSYFAKFDEHIQVALDVAREGTVLLRNENNLLPINPTEENSILVTGILAQNTHIDMIPRGCGSAEVDGYDVVTFKNALEKMYGDKIIFAENPTDDEIKKATHVIYSASTLDGEGADRPFDLADSLNADILKVANLNPKTLVVVNSGSGVNMSPWNDKVAGILYGWYPGQIGFQAITEIIAGEINPSGKLPITIEKSFNDSPGFPYIPEGEALYSDWEYKDKKFYSEWKYDMNITHPIHDVNYKEGVFVGYRWYENKNIAPLYPFGYGLSYTTFKYDNLQISSESIQKTDKLNIVLEVENTGKIDGKEIVQIYVRDVESSVVRPVKELKDFRKVDLKAGEKTNVYVTLSDRDFAFWDTESKDWKIEAGKFEILVGRASNDILAKTTFEIK